MGQTFCWGWFQWPSRAWKTFRVGLYFLLRFSVWVALLWTWAGEVWGWHFGDSMFNPHCLAGKIWEHDKPLGIHRGLAVVQWRIVASFCSDDYFIHIYIDYSVFQPEWCIPIWTLRWDVHRPWDEMGCSQTMGSVWPRVWGEYTVYETSNKTGLGNDRKRREYVVWGKGWLWVCHIKNRSGCSGFSTPWSLRTPLDSNSQILASEHTNLSKYTINIPSSVLLWYLN